jgi:hypothetical protein
MRASPGVVCAVVSLLGLALGACSGEVDGNPGNDDPGDEQGGDDDPDAGSGSPDGSGIDAVPSADARTDRFRCQGDPLPTTAADPLTVSGMVSEARISGTSAVVGATVEVFRRSGGGAIATTTSGGGGAYTIAVDTDGEPLDTYVRATSGSLLKTELYAAAPVVRDAASSSFILTSLTLLDFVAGTVSANQTSGRGAATLSIVDCDGNPVEGATVTGFGQTRVFYAVDGKPNAAATATSADGLAFVFDVVPGDVTINATVGGEALRANPIAIRANTVSLAQIAP